MNPSETEGRASNSANIISYVCDEIFNGTKRVEGFNLYRFKETRPLTMIFFFFFFVAQASACSNFVMDNDKFRISVRTMDLGLGSFDMIVTRDDSRFGRVEFVAGIDKLALRHFQTGGLNEAGVSCDQQTLLNASYPTTGSVSTDAFCGTVLSTYSSARETLAAFRNGTIAIFGGLVSHTHFVVRDSLGESLVVEGLNGRVETFLDLNDEGETGFGVFTNEPSFPYHLDNVRHFKWKESLDNSAVTIPGNFYPDERFLRIYLTKRGMSPPDSYVTAVQQAVHVMNTVTVPMGDSQIGTDSNLNKFHDHTLYGVVYDHLDAKVYWRTYKNQNLQLLDLNRALSTLQQENKKKPSTLVFPVIADELPWYNDATPLFATRRSDDA